MWMARHTAGRGLVTEVVVAMLRWGLTDWPWERIEWRCETRNSASARVATKAGMHLDGTLRSASVDRTGERCDLQVFSMLRGETGRLPE
jgi:RimJ/RimL family protein N-acetyltransferase